MSVSYIQALKGSLERILNVEIIVIRIVHVVLPLRKIKVTGSFNTKMAQRPNENKNK